MALRIRFLAFIAILTALVAATFAHAEGESPGRVDVARFDEQGRLQVPEDLEEWIFIGTSLGMGYSQAEFDPGSPGMFQVVRMEPTAWAAFRDSGKFPEGTMLSLHFYGSRNEISINQAGFVMGGLHMAEIHYKDSARFPDGFNFFTFNEGDTTAGEVALPNDCVTCHQRDGAYDGVFVQFYPTIHEYLPAAIREQLAAKGEGRHH